MLKVGFTAGEIGKGEAATSATYSMPPRQAINDVRLQPLLVMFGLSQADSEGVLIAARIRVRLSGFSL